jgi:hypothetical protein
MKLLSVVRPITKAKKAELERAIEDEKKHFKSASQDAMDAISEFRAGFSPKRLAEDYPIETAITIMLAGFAIARLIKGRSAEGEYARTQPDLP